MSVAQAHAGHAHTSFYCDGGGRGGDDKFWQIEPDGRAADCRGWNEITKAVWDAHEAGYTADRSFCFDGPRDAPTRGYQYLHPSDPCVLSSTWWKGTKSDWDAFVAAVGFSSNVEPPPPDDSGPAPTEPDPAPALPPAGDCPTAPDAYAGSDVVVAELRAARREAAATCEALSAELDRVRVATDSRSELNALRFALAPAGSAGLYDKLAVLPAKLDTVDESIRWQGQNGAGSTSSAGTHGATDEEPAFVRLASSDDTRDVLSEATDLQRRDLWFGIGLVCALFFGYLLWRVVSPRA